LTKLPGVVVSDAAAATAAHSLPRWAATRCDAASVAAALPALGASMAALYAALAAFAARDGAEVLQRGAAVAPAEQMAALRVRGPQEDEPDDWETLA